MSQGRSTDTTGTEGTGAAPRPELFTPAFVAVLAGATLYFLNVGAVVPLLPVFAVSDLGASNLVVGLVVGAPAVSALIVRPLAGGYANAVGRSRLMVGGALLAGIATTAYGATDQVAVLIGLRLLTGAGEGAFFTGAAIVVAVLAPESRRGAAISMLSVTVFFGAGLGPILSVPVADAIGTESTFMLAGILGVVAAAVCRRARVPAEGSSGRARQTSLNRKAFGPGLALAISYLGSSGFFAFIPLYAGEVGTPVQAVFVVYSVVILTVRLCGASIPDRLGPARCGIAASILDASGLLLVACAGERMGLLAGVAIFAAGTALLYPALLMLALRDASPAERSSVVGTFTMSFDIGTILGAVLVGAVAELLGLRASFAISGACGLVSLALLLGSLKTSALRRSH